MLLGDDLSAEAVIAATRDAELLLVCYAPVTAECISGARRLRAIIKYGVGIDQIDISAATAAGIPVVNVPAYAEETVAEGAVTLLLALLRRLPTQLAACAAGGGWAPPTPALCGREACGKTVGVVGFGRIGRAFARMCGGGFRMRVLCCDPHVDAAAVEAAVPAGAGYRVEWWGELRAMLAECDIVSLHATLSPASRHLLGPAEFAAMRPGAVLVNTARGGLVDDSALVAAMLSGRLGGVALDVMGTEPFDSAPGSRHPLAALAGMPNVVVTPHTTFLTAEAMARLEDDVIQRCAEAAAGELVLVKSGDPRLRMQRRGVRFEGEAAAPGPDVP